MLGSMSPVDVIKSAFQQSVKTGKFTDEEASNIMKKIGFTAPQVRFTLKQSNYCYCLTLLSSFAIISNVSCKN